jgi:RecA-family ATPase
MTERTKTPARVPAFSTPLDVRALLTSPPPPLDHVLPGLLCGTVGMLAGPGGVGKTMLELQLAAALATGTPACAGLFSGLMPAAAPAPVVLVTAEESTAVLQHRLHAIACALFEQRERFGITLDYAEFVTQLGGNLRLFAGASHRYALLDRNMKHTSVLQDLGKACEGARLVLIDPLRQFHECDENDSAAMNLMVQTLRRLAERTGAAVVFAHHATKAATFAGQGDAAGAARGSSALTDGVRWQLNLSRMSREQAQQAGIAEDARGQFLLLDVAKSNYLAPQPTQRLQRLAGGVLARVEAAAERDGLHAGTDKPWKAPRQRPLKLHGGRQ